VNDRLWAMAEDVCVTVSRRLPRRLLGSDAGADDDGDQEGSAEELGEPASPDDVGLSLLENATAA
jgi:hypothetical protein